ncbi:Splicing factor SPF30 [Ceraceosorus bombacis]|uniref:Splicing factor SPF30 n=1 Tax=Ceraceosorus bombacis TaxID=401625 RepID=A0A0P1BM66_9BASI|nr:Splicing factor SPF30 [Ceraceosorus bombacis]
MDATELQSYEFQLSQVNDALSADPNNAELKTLHEELTNLITLTRELVSQQTAEAQAAKAASSSPHAGSSKLPSTSAKSRDESPRGESSNLRSTATEKEVRKYAAGEECMAKYQADGRWYPARITSVGGSAANPVYSIVFKGYNTTEMVTSASLKPLARPSGPGAGTGSSDAASNTPVTKAGIVKRGASTLTPEEEAERERKRKRNEKKTERSQGKDQAALEKQSTWQKFAKKGAKKGYSIAGTSGKSMFRTPEDPLARVGVVGAGKGMTPGESRKRHVYEED